MRRLRTKTKSPSFSSLFLPELVWLQWWTCLDAVAYEANFPRSFRSIPFDNNRLCRWNCLRLPRKRPWSHGRASHRLDPVDFYSLQRSWSPNKGSRPLNRCCRDICTPWLLQRLLLSSLLIKLRQYLNVSLLGERKVYVIVKPDCSTSQKCQRLCRQVALSVSFGNLRSSCGEISKFTAFLGYSSIMKKRFTIDALTRALLFDIGWFILSEFECFRSSNSGNAIGISM